MLIKGFQERTVHVFQTPTLHTHVIRTRNQIVFVKRRTKYFVYPVPMSSKHVHWNLRVSHVENFNRIICGTSNHFWNILVKVQRKNSFCLNIQYRPFLRGIEIVNSEFSICPSSSKDTFLIGMPSEFINGFLRRQNINFVYFLLIYVNEIDDPIVSRSQVKLWKVVIARKRINDFGVHLHADYFSPLRKV